MPHIWSHRAPCLCFPKKVSFQLSSEQSIVDVWTTQLDRKRVTQARSSGCKSFVAVTAKCSRYHASQNISYSSGSCSHYRFFLGVFVVVANACNVFLCCYLHVKYSGKADNVFGSGICPSLHLCVFSHRKKPKKVLVRNWTYLARNMFYWTLEPFGDIWSTAWGRLFIHMGHSLKYNSSVNFLFQ